MAKEGDSHKIPYTALVSAGVSILALIAIRRRIKAKRKAAQQSVAKVEQLKRYPTSTLSSQSEPSTTQLFQGIRVLEVATHVAAPTVSRAMADLGAEVIKVESPGGDLFRKTLLAFEQPRRFGTMFEGQNLGKSSIVLDLKTEEGMTDLKQLIKGADVLITNTRNRSLIDLGLTYDNLKTEFPTLIFAQVSAWGLQGPDKDLPGYDVGAFWAGSGAAVYTNEAGNYDTYTGALGDFTTGQFLLAGVSVALKERLSTGRGRKVGTSLLHCGVWCMSPHVVNARPEKSASVGRDYSKVPPKKIVDGIYQTKDEKPVVVSFVGSTQDENHAEEELRTLLNIPTEDLSYEGVARVVLQRTHDEVADVLMPAKRLKVAPLISIVQKWEEMATFSPREDHSTTLTHEVFDIPPGDYVKEVPCIPRIPYEFSCSQHKPSMRAPDLGAHSEDVLARGWLSPASSSTPTTKPSSEEEGRSRLSGVVVVELCDVTERHDVAVASTGALLASLGATVYKIKAKGGSGADADPDPLREHSPQTYAQFHRRKKLRELKELPSLWDQADVLLTDMSTSKLEAMDVNIDKLRATHKRLVIVRMVASVKNDDLSPFTTAFAQSGTASIYSGLPASTFPRYPEHFLELIGSAFMLAAVTSALYYQESKKIGQVVTVSYERLGHWLAQLTLVFGLRDPKLQSFVVRDNLKSRFRSLLPTYTSRKTKDGVWLQLLGLETKRHLGRTLTALGVKYRTYAGMLVTGICRVLPRFALGSGSTIHKVEPLFECINRNIISGFASKTFDEVQASFKEHDVWHAPFRMPSELLHYEQIIANNIVVETDGDVEVVNPITIH